MTNEVYEVAISEDGSTYGPFEAFTPGDVRLLGNFVKFRVTVFGDFAIDEYRQRGFAGIVDDATTVTGGFGLTPFGRYPFGDGGICLQDSEGDLEGFLSLSGELVLALPNTQFFGTTTLSGQLSVSVSAAESGTLSMSGALTAVVPVFKSVDGALSMSGGLATVVTQPGRALIHSWIGGGTAPFLGTRYFAPTSQLSVPQGSPAAVNVEIPVAISLTQLTVKCPVALVTTVLTAKYVINSVVDNSIVLTMNPGDQVKTATGSAISVNANDLVCIEVTLANASNSIEQITVTYQAA